MPSEPRSNPDEFDATRRAPEGAAARERKRRRGRAKRRRGGSLTLIAWFAPMIDVVFLLMLYFMLSFEFAPPESVLRTQAQEDAQVEAPADPLALPARPVEIRVRSLGPGRHDYAIRVDDPVLASAATFEELRRLLDAARGDAIDAGQAFVLRPAPDARWEHTLGAFNAITRAGYASVEFAEAGP